MVNIIKSKISKEKEENIFTAFKDEMGYTCATNQYVEMAVLLAERDYKVQIDTDMQNLARSVGLTVSSLSDDYRLRISKGYIINVYAVLEKFLIKFRELPGSSTNICNHKRGKDESYLKWILDALYSNSDLFMAGEKE